MDRPFSPTIQLSNSLELNPWGSWCSLLLDGDYCAQLQQHGPPVPPTERSNQRDHWPSSLLMPSRRGSAGGTEKEQTNTHVRVYTTNDTPRGHQYHTTTIVSPGARGRGRPGGTQQSKGIYSGYFCLLPLLLKLVNLDLDLVLVLKKGDFKVHFSKKTWKFPLNSLVFGLTN